MTQQEILTIHPTFGHPINLSHPDYIPHLPELDNIIVDFGKVLYFLTEPSEELENEKPRGSAHFIPASKQARVSSPLYTIHFKNGFWKWFNFSDRKIRTAVTAPLEAIE